jgi:hypothetical protein
MKLPLLFLLLAASCCAQTTGNADTKGPCSPAVSGSGNRFTISCQGISKEQGDKMLQILNTILANQANSESITAKLDEILKAVQSLDLTPKVTTELINRETPAGAKHPHSYVQISIDKPLADAKFIIQCDRPCAASDHAGLDGYNFVRNLVVKDNPNVAIFDVHGPNPFPSDRNYWFGVESMDDQSVKIVGVSIWKPTADQKTQLRQLQ